MEIIRAKAGDLQTVADLRRTMAMEMGNDWDRDHPGWQQRMVGYLRQKQAAGTAQVFYASAGDRIVGMLTVSLVDDYHAYARHKKSGRINAVYVEPASRRHGIAREMMLSAMDWLRDKGCVSVRLNSSESAIPFYESIGFRPGREMELSL